MLQPPKPVTATLLFLTLTFTLASCGDDPELVRKREEQRAEIQRLQGELAILQEKLKNAPADQSEELAKTEEEITQEQSKISSLETEIASLKDRRRDVEEKLKRFQREYPLR